jgi:two-component system nitrate/nitrite response regulator NarL
MQARGSDPPPIDVPPIKVLIVDDDDTFVRSTARILQRAGYDCREAANGDEAREHLASEADIAAVLCDLRIPGESGFGVLATLASAFPDVAVVMITGVDDPLTAALAFEIGADAYLIKPFSANELGIALAGALRSRKLDATRAGRVGVDDRDDESPIRVLVVDDHEIFVQSLLRLLNAQPTIEVVGSAATVREAKEAVVAHHPDVILMDFELPDGDGAEATEAVKALAPEVKVVMLTGRTDNPALIRAIGAGCAGFVTKTDTVDKLIDAIHSAHDGDTPAASTDLPHLLAQLRPTSRGLGSDLSTRELNVLRLMAAGVTNKAVAEQLHLSINTVRNHVQSVLYKLEAHSKLEAVATAVSEGLIERPSAR